LAVGRIFREVYQSIDTYTLLGKIAEKAVCRSVFLTILSAELTKNALLQTMCSKSKKLCKHCYWKASVSFYAKILQHLSTYSHQILLFVMKNLLYFTAKKDIN